MQVIWKYEIPIGDGIELRMPDNAEILTVQSQRDQGVLWAKVDPEAKTVTRMFSIRGTGHRYDKNGERYIGTWQQAGGALVWHLFERGV